MSEETSLTADWIVMAMGATAASYEDEISRLREQIRHSEQEHGILVAALDDEIDRLLRVQDDVVAAFRQNMIRSNPHYTHEAFDELIAQIRDRK